MPFTKTAKGNMQSGLTANIGSVFGGKKDMHMTWKSPITIRKKGFHDGF